MCRAPVGSPSCGSMVPLFIFPLWVFLHDWFPRRWPRLVPPSPAPIGSPVTKFQVFFSIFLQVDLVSFLNISFKCPLSFLYMSFNFPFKLPFFFKFLF